LKLTANEKRKLRHLWKGDYTIEKIREDMEFDEGQLAAAVAFLGLPAERECKPYIPTREEIRLATAEIRSNWSQTEREERIRSAWGGTINVRESSSDDGRN